MHALSFFTFFHDRAIQGNKGKYQMIFNDGVTPNTTNSIASNMKNDAGL